MDLSKILAITGKPGLYKMVGQMKNGVLVESLEDQKRFPAYSSQQISLLSEISIYLDNGDIPLSDVLASMFEQNGGNEVDAKDGKALFESAVEDYDRDRVYASDIKKVIRWYNLLVQTGYLNADSVGEEPEGDKE